MKKIILYGLWWISIPHLLLFHFSSQRKIIKQDLSSWRKRHEPGLSQCLGKICQYLKSKDDVLLVYLILFRPEFRNIFYHRIGASKFLLYYLPPLSSLYINTPSRSIGGGLYIEHGFSTIINAYVIGEYCHINQQVTIGTSDSKTLGHGEPSIGDNVRIYAGAIVVGNIRVGNYSIIGAGTTVVKDIPDNAVVTSQTAVIRQF